MVVGLLEVPEKFRVVVVVGGSLDFSVYLSPLRGEMSRTKSTRQVLDRFLDIFLVMFLDIFLDRERRQETRRGDRLRQLFSPEAGILVWRVCLRVDKLHEGEGSLHSSLHIQREEEGQVVVVPANTLLSILGDEEG